MTPENRKLADKIKILKDEKNAVILSHNYQADEVQEIADFTGDSLELSIKARGVDRDIIVFAGVRFMAESAKILNPGKKVLLTEERAGCPMADMITPEKLLELKNKYPGRPVVCYVNSDAAVKALSDICCTSSNAVKIVNSLKEKEVIFIPDMYLASYVEKFTDKKIIKYKGFCPVHQKVSASDIMKLKNRQAGAVTLAHPECSPEVTVLADAVLSTSGMIKYAASSAATDFIIATEKGILYRLKKDSPGKNFHLASRELVCPNMKLTGLKSILDSLLYNKYVVSVPPDVIERAKTALDRMLEVTAGGRK